MIQTDPIKILQIVSDLRFGGSEKLAAFLADAMREQGFETCVLGLYGGGPVTEELKKKNIPYFFFNYKNRIDERLWMHKKLYQLIKKNDIDIIQVHGSYPLTRILPSAKMANVKVIYTEHAKRSLQLSSKLRAMTKLSSLFCNKIITVSNNLKDYLVFELGVDEKKIAVVHNGVDLSRFDGSEYREQIPGLPEKGDNVLWIGIVGRLTDAKDHMGYFNALKDVSESEKRLQTFIIGDGELRKALQLHVKYLELSDRVVFLGQRDDISRIISRMDFMVLPSKREGFPISVLESMAMGKPVIATRVGGVSEIIQHGINGYLIPAQDKSALVDALRAFSVNKEQFLHMGKLARKTILEKFSDVHLKKTYGRMYETVYQNL